MVINNGENPKVEFLKVPTVVVVRRTIPRIGPIPPVDALAP
jgi:hypothetical protein